MVSIWEYAFKRSYLNIETIWLLFLGVCIGGLVIPWAVPCYPLAFLDWWFDSYLVLLRIGISVAVMTTIVIYGYEVVFLNYLKHEDDWKGLGYWLFHWYREKNITQLQKQVDTINEQISEIKEEYKEMDKIKEDLKKS